MNDIADRADEIFVSQSLLEEGALQGAPFGVREIAMFLTDHTVQLLPEQTRLLFSDRSLNDAYQRLKARLTAIPMPMVAAASDGDVIDRVFPGAQIRVRPSKRKGQSFLVIFFEAGHTDPSPSILVLQSQDEIVKLALPAADDQGQCIIILDEADSHDARTLAFLVDPFIEGAFIL